MADNRFLLFRTPFLALCIILNFYNPHDIIQLSLCSKRSLRVAKKCWKKRGVVKAEVSVDTVSKINLHFHGTRFNYQFVISQAKDLQDELTHNVRVGDAVVPSNHKDTERVTYWDDKIFGIEQFVSYIKDLFDVPLTTVELKEQDNPNDIIRIINFIKSSQESIKDCRLYHMNPMDDCLKHLLDNFKTFGKLLIHGGPTRQFRHDWNIHLDDFFIWNSSSITLQNLININCPIMKLYNSSLTREDLNQFLKNWQNGGNSRIKFLSIRINPLIQETITSGIDFVLQPQVLRRYYRGMNNIKVLMNGGIDILRNDGKIGSIFFYNNKFEFGVDPIED